MRTQSSPQNIKIVLQTKKKNKDLNELCNLSPNEAKRNPSGKEENRLKINQKTLIITEQVQKSNHKVNWMTKEPKIPTGGSMHKATRCPRAGM